MSSSSPQRPSRRADGSAGDADYASIGTVYRDYHVAEPRIATFVHAALGDARTVLNIGAGIGSYEPIDRDVTAVEPSATMRARRSGQLPEAVDAYAEQLPFPDRCFDAAMGTLTVHQWADLVGGLREVRRVTRGSVVFLTCDPALLRTYWLCEYSPEVIEICSAWSFVDPSAVARFETHLARDLSDGTWDARYGHLRSQAYINGSLVLVVSVPET